MDRHTAPSDHTGTRIPISHGTRYLLTGVSSIPEKSNCLDPWWWPDRRQTSSTCWFRIRPHAQRTKYPLQIYNMSSGWGWDRPIIWLYLAPRGSAPFLVWEFAPANTEHIVKESPVVETPRRSSTANNRSLAVMESPRCHLPLARGAVSNTCISSLDLQTCIDPLPMDQLLCYSPSTVHSWPAEDREQILAVASRDMVIARKNVADMSRYLDAHAAHVAACSAFRWWQRKLSPGCQVASGRPCKKCRGTNMDIIDFSFIRTR